MIQNELLEMIKNRRSVREYSGERIPDESIEMILQAGLLAPSAMNKKPVELVLVRERETLDQLAVCRPTGTAMLAQADAAIVTFGDSDKSPLWTEDCCIAQAYMHLMADSLGVGSCWLQGRTRTAPDGRSTEDYIKDLLGLPESYRLESILSLGMPADHPAPRDITPEDEARVHR